MTDVRSGRCMPMLVPAIGEEVMRFVSTLPGTPAIHNAIPMPLFGTTPFAASGLGILAAAIMLRLRCGGLPLRKARRDPALMPRVAVIGAGTLDNLPHTGRSN